MNKIKFAGLYVLFIVSFIVCSGGPQPQKSGQTETLPVSKIPVNSTAYSCNTALLSSSNSPVLTIAQMWADYTSQISQLQAEYPGLPTTINVDSIWFHSLNVKNELFSTRQDSFIINGPITYGVGYGSHTLHNGKKYIFYSDWMPNDPDQGSAFALEYVNDIPACIDYLHIQGSTHSWVLNNQSGSKSVVFMGVDEGKLIDPMAVASSPMYFYNLDTSTWDQSDILTSSHHSIPFDYDSDGDDDIIAQSWIIPFDGKPFILENNGSTFSIKRLGSIVSGMAIAPLGFNNKNQFEYVLTDTGPVPQFNMLGETNYLVKASSDLSLSLLATALPLPYFEQSVFQSVVQIIPDWEGSVGLSHDVSAKAIDLDYDGDKDIIISSMIWSNSQPYGVLQFLINHNGTYIDETSSRLYNWVLISGGIHRLDFIDVNNDGHLDILTSDHGKAFCCKYNLPVESGSRVLLNDGTGHFVTVIHQQVNETGGYLPSFIPSLDSNNNLSWTVIQAMNGSSVTVTTRSLNVSLSTGPNLTDPALSGAPGFNEFYYLLHNPDIRTAIAGGLYATGLEHYLAAGQSEGRQAFAPPPPN